MLRICVIVQLVLFAAVYADHSANVQDQVKNHSLGQLFVCPAISPISSLDVPCKHCISVENEEAIIAFSTHWKVILAQNQTYLGQVVLVSVRHYGGYEQMTPEEAAELHLVLQQLMPALQKVFPINHFNIAYLMDEAYQSDHPEPQWASGKPNPHMHWLLIPRYSDTQFYQGETFTDLEFGALFQLESSQVPDMAWRKKAIEALRKNLKLEKVEVVG